MNFSQHSLVITCSIFSLIVVGFAISRITKRSYSSPLSDYAYFLALPAEIVISLSGADIGSVSESSIFLLAYALSIAVIWAAIACAYTMKFRESRNEIGMALLSIGQTNTAFLGLPIFIVLFGSPRLLLPIILFQSLILTAICVYLMEALGSRARKRSTLQNFYRPLWASFKNPLIVSSFLGVGLALCGVRITQEEIIGSALHMISATAAPVALIALGASFNEETASSLGISRSLEVVSGIFIKSLLHPAVALLIGYLLGLRGETLLALILVAAMPSPKNTFILAKAYGFDATKYNYILLGTTTLSCVVVNGLVWCA